MQITRRDADIGVPGSVANLGQRPPSGQRVADKRVAPVVDGQRFEASDAQDLASRTEALAERVT
jgi:hypothetical protein